MAHYRDIFTLRQTMNRRGFEFYHYLDLDPPTAAVHRHDFYEVFFFVSGTATYTVEGRSCQLRPGDILLTNTRGIHRPETTPGKPYERYVPWIPGFNDYSNFLKAFKWEFLLSPQQLLGSSTPPE